MRWMPLYMAMLLVMFFQRYLNSLTGLFIGEVLGIFNNDASVLPDIVNYFIDNDSVESRITSIAVVYVVVTALSIIGNMLTRTMRAVHYEKLYMDLSKTFYKHVLDIPKGEYASRSTGDIIQRNIEDCKRIPRLFRNSLYELFRIVFTTGTMLYQLFRLSGVVFSVSLVALVICVSFSGYYGYFKIKKKEIASSKYYSELNSTIQQSITNYSLVKSFANETYEYDKFKEINDKKENNNYYINNLHCRYWLISDILTSFYVVGCLIVLAYSFFNGNASLAVVSATAVITSTFLNDGSQIINHITTFVRTFISMKRLNEYFKIASEYENDGNVDKEINGNIVFDKVCMKYDKEYVLKDVSFELHEGETLGIVGKSGSGKTSIVNLLTRLDDYESGSIKVDGVELKDYKKKCIRDNMGVVLQDAYIFSKSIKENLLVLIDNDRVDLDMYLKRVGLDEDINKFESGLETVVGERGVTLSGGQRQRLSLLRTIMKNKKILILDDTLSAVDNIVSKKIKEAISKEKATTIIVSHNLLNIKDADKIIVLDEGKIADIGTHEELISREGFYSNVWNLQQMIEEASE
jgi:ATP-binding cassette subfamily B protein